MKGWWGGRGGGGGQEDVEAGEVDSITQRLAQLVQEVGG
jgi:hypothetical protein